MIKISCVCPTHGRAHVIGEAIESYLRQEPVEVETELLILNDCPEQPIQCDAPGVRVVNVPLMESVCAKFDAVVGMAQGEYIAWWEDDDISLPWRLKRSIAYSELKDNYKQRNAWYMCDNVIQKHGENLFFGNSLFRKADYINGGGAGVNGYPDQTAHMAIMAEVYKRNGYYVMELASPYDIYFMYRWGGPVVHDSGFGAAHNDAAARNELFRQRTLSNPEFRHGMQTIIPHWKHDYEGMAMEAAQKL